MRLQVTSGAPGGACGAPGQCRGDGDTWPHFLQDKKLFPSQPCRARPHLPWAHLSLRNSLCTHRHKHVLMCTHSCTQACSHTFTFLQLTVMSTSLTPLHAHPITLHSHLLTFHSHLLTHTLTVTPTPQLPDTDSTPLARILDQHPLQGLWLWPLHAQGCTNFSSIKDGRLWSARQPWDWDTGTHPGLFCRPLLPSQDILCPPLSGGNPEPAGGCCIPWGLPALPCRDVLPRRGQWATSG